MTKKLAIAIALIVGCLSLSIVADNIADSIINQALASGFSGR